MDWEESTEVALYLLSLLVLRLQDPPSGLVVNWGLSTGLFRPHSSPCCRIWGTGTLQPVPRRDWDRESEVFPTKSRPRVPPTLCLGDGRAASVRSAVQRRGGPLVSLLPSVAPFDISPFSRMEKLGNEIATLFTHSHIVSLVVSLQLSSSSPFTLPPSPSGSTGVTVPAAAGPEAFRGA